MVAGETSLFGLIMRRHNQRLFRVVRGVLGSDEEAEDALQQAYLSAFLHLAQFTGPARLATWLTRIALHEALARKGKRTHRAEVDLREEDDLLPSLQTPEDQASTRELAGFMERAIGRLSGIYRVVFMMREVEQLSVAETADCLEVSEEVVRVRLHRAKQLLQKTILAETDTVAVAGSFVFLGARCERLRAAVMARIAVV